MLLKMVGEGTPIAMQTPLRLRAYRPIPSSLIGRRRLSKVGLLKILQRIDIRHLWSLLYYSHKFAMRRMFNWASTCRYRMQVKMITMARNKEEEEPFHCKRPRSGLGLVPYLILILDSGLSNSGSMPGPQPIRLPAFHGYRQDETYARCPRGYPFERSTSMHTQVPFHSTPLYAISDTNIHIS